MAVVVCCLLPVVGNREFDYSPTSGPELLDIHAQKSLRVGDSYRCHLSSDSCAG